MRGKNGRLVEMCHVGSLKLENGSLVPSYQTYVALAWLVRIGAVKKYGRESYKAQRPAELKRTIKAAWANLDHASA